MKDSPQPTDQPAGQPTSHPATAATSGPTADRKAYWRKNITYVLSLLSVWFIVSYGAGILFVDVLNGVKIGGAPFGFWMAQQGAIYVFIALIAIYVVIMNRLDRKFGLRED